MVASSVNAGSDSGSGLGGPRTCGVQDSASIIGLNDVGCMCCRVWRVAAEEKEASNGLWVGKEDAIGVATRC